MRGEVPLQRQDADDGLGLRHGIDIRIRIYRIETGIGADPGFPVPMITTREFAAGPPGAIFAMSSPGIASPKSLRNAGQDLGVHVVSHSLDDRDRTLRRVLGLEDSRTDEYGLSAELHHERRIGGSGRRRPR